MQQVSWEKSHFKMISQNLCFHYSLSLNPFLTQEYMITQLDDIFNTADEPAFILLPCTGCCEYRDLCNIILVLKNLCSRKTLNHTNISN